MKRQIIYRLTEILSFYAFLRPDEHRSLKFDLKITPLASKAHSVIM